VGMGEGRVVRLRMLFFVTRRVFFVLDNKRDDTAECIVSWRHQVNGAVIAVSIISLFQHSQTHSLQALFCTKIIIG
jgi:hypothetical protein